VERIYILHKYLLSHGFTYVDPVVGSAEDNELILFAVLLHFAWVVDDAKCIVVTRVCVCVRDRMPTWPHAYSIAQTRM